MKRNKGFTLVELLICIAIIGIITVIAFPNLKAAIKKSKEKAYAEKHNIEYTLPIQQVKQEVRSSRISISKVAELEDITLYIAKDLNNGNEFLVTQFHKNFNPEGSVAVALMPRTAE
jgi:prepilin-type N-terminal cleavage/methylation domain-containing protein